ncbi:MAG: hypothetical protein AB1714_12735 [Acidobacteriota bacterium]
MQKRAELDRVRPTALSRRDCKVWAAHFAKVCKRGTSFRSFYESLPAILAGQDFRSIVTAVVAAARRRRMVLLMMGAHVIKCGLSPLIIDLMKRGIVKAVAMNGAGVVHDTEIAMIGRTSEDVAEGIADGSFGMARETAQFINVAVAQGYAAGEGFGEAVGREIVEEKLRHRELSILAAGHTLAIPVTVHVAIGTDIVHQHPTADGEAIGGASFLDFRSLIHSVSRLDGGVVLNVGSAVVLPEVFLKALTVARNLGFRASRFTAVDFDMIRQYRPRENVVTRPTSAGGRGYQIVGHHELMIPLMHRAIVERI